jgi:elongation factor 1-beta
MGDVVVTINVMPEDMEGFAKLKQDLLESLKGSVKNCDISEQEVAFGMKAIKLTIIIPDGEGGVDTIEEKIKKTSNVSSAEVVSLDRFGV